MSQGSSSSTRRRGTKRAERQQHLLDHFALIRSHALWGVLAALIVFSFLIVRAFRTAPTYRSDALIHLDVNGDGGEASFIPSMAVFGKVSMIQPEVEALLSMRMATATAASPRSPLRVIVSEANVFRPLDELLRRIKDTAPRCRIRGTADAPLAAPLRAVLKPIRDGESLHLEIERVVAGERTTETIKDFRFGEPWDDANSDGLWNAPEAWTDVNGNGTFDQPEPYMDMDGNDRWDPRESFDDRDGDGVCDPQEPYSDRNGNGRWDEGEPYDDLDRDGHHDDAEDFEDTDRNGVWLRFEEYYEDTNGNGRYDRGDHWDDADGDRTRDEGETYKDIDGDGAFSKGTPILFGERVIHLTLEHGDPVGRRFVLVGNLDKTVARQVRHNVRVRANEDYSGIVRVWSVAPSPYTARDQVSSLLNTYFESKQAQKEEISDRVLTYLRGERSRVERELRRAQRQRDDFVIRTGATHLSERASSAYAERAEIVRRRLELNFQLKQLQDRIDALNLTGSRLDEALASLSVNDVDPQTKVLVDERLNLELEISAAGKARENHPRIKPLRERLATVEQRLQRSIGALVRRHRTALTSERRNVESRLTQLAEEESRNRSLIARLPDNERQRLDLERPLQELEAARTQILSWHRDAEVAKASSVSGARLIDEADLRPHRIAPNLVREGLVALILALAAGIGACYLREYLDRKVKLPRTLAEVTGLPVYATIPSFDSVRRRDRPRRRQPMVTVDRPTSVLSEAYRTLRSSIRNENREAPVKTLSVTSPMQAEGKSITTCNLAATLALAGSRTLVIDADLRRPSTHRYAQGARSPGVSEILEDGVSWRDALQPGPTDNLFFIHAGRSVRNPSGLLDSANFERLVDDASADFDYVLVDVPPVLAVADAASFLHRLDAVLLLVHTRRYPPEIVEDAMERP